MEKKEVFKILKRKYKEKGGREYEFISSLENISYALIAIEEDSFPKEKCYRKALAEQNYRVLEQYLEFYKKLYIDLDFVDKIGFMYEFEPKINAYIVCMNRNSRHYVMISKDWTIQTFPMEDFFPLLNSITNYFQQKNGNEEGGSIKRNLKYSYRDAATEQANTFVRDFSIGESLFDDLLRKNKRLLICNFDINFYNFCEEKFDQSIMILCKVRDQLIKKHNLVADFSKIEVDLYNNLIFKKIYIFRDFLDSDTKGTVQIIHDFICEILKEGANDFNILTSTCGVSGLNDPISIDSIGNSVTINCKEKIDQFKYWVLGNIFTTNMFFRRDIDNNVINSHSSQVIIIDYSNVIASMDEASHDRLAKIKKDTRVSSKVKKVDKFIDLKISNKKISRTKGLPKNIQDEIHIMKLLYLNYIDEKYLEILLDIEYFMRFLQCNKGIAFRPYNIYLHRSRFSEIPKSLSDEAKLYLAISKKLLTLDNEVLLNWQNVSCISHRVKKFLLLFHPRSFPIDRRGAFDFSQMMLKLKSNGMDKKNNIFILDYKETFKLGENKKRLRTYLDKYLQQDFFAFRIKFFLDTKNPETLNLSTETFKDYLKNLKRTKKNSGANLIAYLGVKLFDEENGLNADVTFIFESEFSIDDSTIYVEEQVHGVIDSVCNSWMNYTEIKKKNIIRNTCKVRGPKRPFWLSSLNFIDLSRVTLSIDWKDFYNSNLIIKRNYIKNEMQLKMTKLDTMSFDCEKMKIRNSINEEGKFFEIKNYEKHSVKKFKEDISNLYVGHQLLYSWGKLLDKNYFLSKIAPEQLMKGNK